MRTDFATAFNSLKTVFGKSAKRLAVQKDTPAEYTVVTKSPSPFPQHKGHPMFFGSVRRGKAYVSFHLMPVYMNPAPSKNISPALQQRMQGKTCFNFKSDPDSALITELKALTAAALKDWGEKKWL